jgi:sarcosine oxidase subunit beta
VSGTSIAQALASRRLSVVLLERENIAAGSTGKSAGIITHYFPDPFMTELELRAGAMLREFEARCGVAIDLVQSDYLYFLPHSEMLAFKKVLSLFQQKGIPIEALSCEAVERLHPALTYEGVGSAAVAHDTYYADAHSVAMGYARAAEQQGAQIYRGLSAVGIKTRDDKVHAVVTSKGEIETRAIVNAAGPWAKAVGLMAGIELPLQLLRHQVMLFRPPFEMKFQASDLVHKTYWRPEAGGYLLVGGGEGDDELIENPDFFNRGVDIDLVADLGARVTTRIPAFAEAEYITGWSGLLDCTPDWHPILGQVPWIEGFYLACGFSGHGFHLAPMTGQLMAELIVDGQYQTLDASVLGIERFERGPFFRRSFLDT